MNIQGFRGRVWLDWNEHPGVQRACVAGLERTSRGSEGVCGWIGMNTQGFRGRVWLDWNEHPGVQRACVAGLE